MRFQVQEMSAERNEMPHGQSSQRNNERICASSFSSHRLGALLRERDHSIQPSLFTRKILKHADKTTTGCYNPQFFSRATSFKHPKSSIPSFTLQFPNTVKLKKQSEPTYTANTPAGLDEGLEHKSFLETYHRMFAVIPSLEFAKSSTSVPSQMTLTQESNDIAKNSNMPLFGEHEGNSLSSIEIDAFSVESAATKTLSPQLDTIQQLMPKVSTTLQVREIPENSIHQEENGIKESQESSLSYLRDLGTLLSLRSADSHYLTYSSVPLSYRNYESDQQRLHLSLQQSLSRLESLQTIELTREINCKISEPIGTTQNHIYSPGHDSRRRLNLRTKKTIFGLFCCFIAVLRFVQTPYGGFVLFHHLHFLYPLVCSTAKILNFLSEGCHILLYKLHILTYNASASCTEYICRKAYKLTTSSDLYVDHLKQYHDAAIELLSWILPDHDHHAFEFRWDVNSSFDLELIPLHLGAFCPELGIFTQFSGTSTNNGCFSVLHSAKEIDYLDSTYVHNFSDTPYNGAQESICEYEILHFEVFTDFNLEIPDVIETRSELDQNFDKTHDCCIDDTWKKHLNDTRNRLTESLPPLRSETFVELAATRRANEQLKFFREDNFQYLHEPKLPRKIYPASQSPNALYSWTSSDSKSFLVQNINYQHAHKFVSPMLTVFLLHKVFRMRVEDSFRSMGRKEVQGNNDLYNNTVNEYCIEPFPSDCLEPACVVMHTQSWQFCLVPTLAKRRITFISVDVCQDSVTSRDHALANTAPYPKSGYNALNFTHQEVDYPESNLFRHLLSHARGIFLSKFGQFFKGGIGKGKASHGLELRRHMQKLSEIFQDQLFVSANFHELYLTLN